MSRRFDYRQLDDVIHSRIRLAIMSLLTTVDEADFTHIRDRLATTDGNLITHIKKLREAGYIMEKKRRDGRRNSTFYRVTGKGRSAFEDYLTTLEEWLPR